VNPTDRVPPSLFEAEEKETEAMRNRVSHVLLMCLFAAFQTGFAGLPSITHYGLHVQFLLSEQRIRTVAAISIRNDTRASSASISLLLYRLLAVEQVKDHSGGPLGFAQRVIPLSDAPSLQAREVTVFLPSPLAPGDSMSMTVTYSGFMFGYPEVMAYVNDRIDEAYSLLRPDALAFPIIADTTFASVLASYDTRFTYDVVATVPRGYTAACGGAFLRRRDLSDSTTFEFRSQTPTWRMDLAVARFSVLRDTAGTLMVYYLPEDSTGAANVLHASRNVVALYSGMFGSPVHSRGYTIIEIPEGWGSQAGDFYFLQTAASFRDSSRIGEVYHEIGHSWNAKSTGDVQRCRYFDEAFASFFEPLALRSFKGEGAFRERMESIRDAFAGKAVQDPEVYGTPIADYGKKELGRHSYTKGAWSLYVLYSLVGEKTFDLIIRALLREFGGRAIDFSEFQMLCERVSKRPLAAYFREWIYGTESSRLMVEKIPMTEITARY